MNLPEIYFACPSVFCVEKEYQIIVPVKENCLMWVEISDKKFYDSSNGVMRTQNMVHRVHVPQSDLDSAKSYTVVTKKVIDRKPYFPEFEDEVRMTFSFRPVKTEGSIRVHLVSDTHSLVSAPLDGYKNSPEADILILNGDVPNDSGSMENICTIYLLAGLITKGEFPAVFSRGNHDTRGIYAESFTDLTPNCRGLSYFTFRAGSLWGMVVDCAEDKTDDHAEYGGTICCHDFRLDECEFIKKTIANAESEYAAPDVKHKIVVAHCPFPTLGTCNDPFNIELDIYKRWTESISGFIDPDIMLFGHFHTSRVVEPGDDFDYYKSMKCDAVIAGIPNHAENTHIAASISLDGGKKYQVSFVKGTGTERP